MPPQQGATPPHRSLPASRAFRAAALRSEIRRAYAVIGVIVLILVLVLTGRSREQLDFTVHITAAVGLLALLGLQLAMISLARWAAHRDRDLPGWLVTATVVLECLVPTGMIAAHIASGTLPPYAFLSSPPILAYGTLITLTTLRLRPALCVLAGAVSAGGYGAVLAFVIYGMNLTRPTTGLPPVAYLNTAMLVFISGLAAAWVAQEIRAHVEAALGEAETRRRMDRIDHDLATARSIQRALLPRAAPDVPGFDIAGWNRPADQTGGDYYDWQALPDGNWIVTLADVSGHGVGPALVTAACRAYVRASGCERGDLASLTGRINRLLADDLSEGRFVTMVSVLLDPGGGPLALLSAGHGPIVLYVGTTGIVTDVMPRDLPLAIDPDCRFGPADTIVMADGDVLALVTDGFVEWSRRDGDGRREEFGLQRLRDSLRRHAALPAAAMIDAMTADVTAFAGQTPQQDDLTMVIIRRVAGTAQT